MNVYFKVDLSISLIMYFILLTYYMKGIILIKRTLQIFNKVLKTCLFGHQFRVLKFQNTKWLLKVSDSSVFIVSAVLDSGHLRNRARVSSVHLASIDHRSLVRRDRWSKFEFKDEKQKTAIDRKPAVYDGVMVIIPLLLYW